MEKFETERPPVGTNILVDALVIASRKVASLFGAGRGGPGDATTSSGPSLRLQLAN